MLATCVPGTQVAGVLTRSATAAAPVDWCRDHLAIGSARGLVVNAGVANAFTGALGIEAVRRTATATAEILGCLPSEIFIASTGVIGDQLDGDRLIAALTPLHARIDDAGWDSAARAIMTTDTFAKGATRRVPIGDTSVTINGIAKGSGMIAPDLATMLAFVFTDATIPARNLRALLKDASEQTFNAITVDGDTSTNDTALLFATGKGAAINEDTAHWPQFKEALQAVCADLAQQIVRDGEGAQKLISITVSGAQSATAARRIAMSIANSPLVKTAVAGADPNWGRIVMAAGKSGERMARDKITIRVGGAVVAEAGGLSTDGAEEAAAAHLKGREVDIEVNVAVGSASATVWTCDLTEGYIDINVRYRS
jgi:glutamate N-acetyltransferase/amino-acid N-acetyltransferase